MPEDAQSNSASTNAKSEVAVSWARERLDDAGPFLAPVMAALVVIGLFCVYYFIYVRAQREYLVNRNFRALAALGDQIEGNIGNHINVLRYFVDQVDSPDRYVHDRQKVPPPGVDDKETREDYMRFLAPDLHLDEGELTGKNLDVRRHNGRWELTMAADGKTKGFSGTVSFQQLVQPFVGSLPFDDDSLPVLLNKVAKGEYYSAFTFVSLLSAD